MVGAQTHAETLSGSEVKYKRDIPDAVGMWNSRAREECVDVRSVLDSRDGRGAKVRSDAVKV